MKKENITKGFTLIELLVVVLIIGILAAVALPQYNKAVLKSRVTELTSFFNAAEKAMDLYFMDNGPSSADWEVLHNKLDFDFSSFGTDVSSAIRSFANTWQAEIYTDPSGWAIAMDTWSRFGGIVRIIKSYNTSTGTITQTCTWSSNNKDKGKDICEAFVANKSGWTVQQN